MITAGVDAGSRALKIVIFDTERDAVLASGVTDQGIEQERLARELLGDLKAQAGLNGDGPQRVVATGYGRGLIGFADKTVTEITCHARGVSRVTPGVRTIVEIGGQDSKTILLDEGGRVQDFAMNDRCAAGTGCFLEVVARRLGLDLKGLGELALQSEAPAEISSMCVVFAETEIVGLLASGRAPSDIAAGVQQSIARRIHAMTPRRFAEPVVFTGGVVHAPGMREALAKRLECPVAAAPTPQLTGALGAALIAADGMY